MQVKEVSSEGLKREYSVTIAADNLNKKIEQKLHSLGGSVKLPGFRPGKIPLKVLQQRYGQRVRAEVVEQSVRDAGQQVLKDKEVRAASQPHIDLKTDEEGKDLEFSLSLEIFPDIPELDFSGLTLERHTFEVSDEDVQKGLERLAENNKKPVAIKGDRKAKTGDQVLIDFLGKRDGTPFDGGEGKDFPLELGSGSFIPGFEDQVIGHKAGEEFTITVTFPEAYHSKDLAGQEVTFDIKLHEIREMVVPEIDEEFAKEHRFESLDDLKEKVKGQLEEDYGQLVRNRLKKNLFDLLDEQIDFTLPEGMRKQEFEGIWQRIEQAKEAGEDVFEGRDEKEVRAEYEALAARRVKLGLFLAEISNREKLEVGQEELRKAIFEQARNYPGSEMQVLEFYQKNPQAAQELAGPLLEEKAVDFILDKVKYKDSKATLDELLDMDRKDVEESAGKKKPAKKTAAAKKSDEKKDMAKKDDAKPAKDKPAAKKKAS